MVAAAGFHRVHILPMAIVHEAMKPSQFGACARACVTLLLVAGMSGCTILETCELHNGSGAELTIVRSRGGNEEPPIQVKAGASVLLSDWMLWEYSLTTGGRTFRYAPKTPGPEFVVNRGFGPWIKRIFVAQMDSAGHIFVVKPGQGVLVEEYVTQPDGFPLMPIISR